MWPGDVTQNGGWGASVRKGSQRDFAAILVTRFGGGKTVRTERKGHLKNIFKVTVETYRSQSVNLGYEIKTCLPSEMNS